MANTVDAGLPSAHRPTAVSATVRPGWSASLSFSLRARAGRTRLFEQAHSGPLRLQREFHPGEDGTAHVYLLHPPGGVVGGDALSINGRLLPGAQALITTPGATKIYRSSGQTANVAVRLSVAADSDLEYLPQETIVSVQW